MVKKVRFTLIDDPDSRHKIKGTFHDDNGTAMIFVDGYGLEGREPVAAIVLQDGKLRLLAFNDINSDEPVTIELEGAKVKR